MNEPIPGIPERFWALVADEERSPASFRELRLDDLDEDEVTLEVTWSSLNYKDALAVTGRAPVVRRFPLVCGIDLGGRVVTSTVAGVVPGEEVIVTGYGLGEERNGGYAPVARVGAKDCVRCPEGLDLPAAMALGTAGLTAMLAVEALEAAGLDPQGAKELPILVTGANGGVGSLSVLLLAALGYEVVASTGRRESEAHLRALGAAGVLDRRELEGSVPPLAHVRFAGAIDVVGGVTLGNVLAATSPGGAVAACGLAGGADLPTSVHPFILRGVSLLGINAVRPPRERRDAAWVRLASHFPRKRLDRITTSARLTEVPVLAQRLLGGELSGRVVVEVGFSG